MLAPQTSASDSLHRQMALRALCKFKAPVGGYTCKADDRRMTKSADFIARFYRPIFSAKLEQVLLLNLSPQYRPIKSDDKIGRVTYKSPPIFCRPIKSPDFIIRLSSL